MSNKISDIDLSKCLICGNKLLDTGNDVCRKPKNSSITNIDICVKQRDQFSSSPSERYAYCRKTYITYGADFLAKFSVMYHRSCYQELTNKTTIKRLQDKYVESASEENNNSEPAERYNMRSSTSRPSKDICVFCGEHTKETLHSVMTSNVGNSLKLIASNTTNVELKVRLNGLLTSDELAAVASDIKYHNRCRTAEERKVVKSLVITSNEANGRTDVDNLFKHTVYSTLHENSISMNEALEMYEQFLNNENMLPRPSDKVYIKTLLSENLYVSFIKPRRANESEAIILNREIDEILKETPRSDVELLRKAAMILRKSVLQKKAWKFEGDFRSFVESDLLVDFFRVGISGITKDYSFSCFLNATEFMLDGLAQLGNSDTVSDDVYSKLTASLCKLYRTKFTQIEKARWYHFCLGAEGAKLPPTKGIAYYIN